MGAIGEFQQLQFSHDIQVYEAHIRLASWWHDSTLISTVLVQCCCFYFLLLLLGGYWFYSYAFFSVRAGFLFHVGFQKGHHDFTNCTFLLTLISPAILVIESPAIYLLQWLVLFKISY